MGNEAGSPATEESNREGRGDKYSMYQLLFQRSANVLTPKIQAKEGDGWKCVLSGIEDPEAAHLFSVSTTEKQFFFGSQQNASALLGR